MRYPEDIDREIVPFLDAVNELPGLKTLYSCCGHGREAFYFVVAARDIKMLMRLLRLLKFSCPEDTVKAIAEHSNEKMFLQSGKINSDDGKFFAWISSRQAFLHAGLDEDERVVACIHSEVVGLLEPELRKHEIESLESSMKALRKMDEDGCRRERSL